MTDAEFLLTDEYAEYTSTISKLHTQKKKKEEDMKVVYEEFKQDMANVEIEAKQAHEKWEAWKDAQSGVASKKAKSKKD